MPNLTPPRIVQAPLLRLSPLDVPCPRCGAPADHRCRVMHEEGSPEMQVWWIFHQARIADARHELRQGIEVLRAGQRGCRGGRR